MTMKTQTSFLAAAVFAVLASTGPASAQEPPDTVVVVQELEVVVGSRAGVADPATLPVPVDIYGAEEIARMGEIDLAEVLGRIAPSFNSTRLSAGDGAALHVATLRGMNGDQVLVLVNGKRRHGVAFAKLLAAAGQGTTGTDLRAIPVHAIERIEVLREGAASQYGSDAIAGVINIVLKDDASGVSASTFLGRTSRGDGLRLFTSANAGVPLGDGFFNITMEVARQDVTNRAGAAPTCFGPDPSYGPCADGGKVIQLQRNGEPDYRGAAFMANAAVPVGESAEFYAFGGYSAREAVSDGLYRKADWVPRSVSYVYPDGFFPVEESDLMDKSAVAGLRGDVGEWSGDLSLGFGHGRFAFGAENSINPSYAAEFLAMNPGADGASIAANAGPRNTFSGGLNVRQWTLNADATRELEVGSTPAFLAVGGAFRRDSYWMEAGDRASWACGPSDTPGSFPAAHHQNDGTAYASCGMQGYPGYSPTSASLSEQDRNSVGAYADMELRSPSGRTLGGALRFEHYTDAGSSLTGKLAGRVGLGETGAALRAAVSTGFRAPRLPQRGFNTIGFVGGSEGLVSAGFLPEGDPIACSDFGACSLGHETSISFTGGLVYATDAGLLVTADYYRVAVRDAIALTRSLDPSHGLRPGAQFQGRPVDAVAFWTNAIDTRTHGFDLAASWRFRGMDWGAADLSASVHRNSTKITANRNENFIGDTQRTLIEDAQPGQRIGVSADIRFARGLGARFGLNRIGSVTTPFIFEENVTIDAATIADLEVSFRVGDRIRVGVGANNLLDRLPNRLPDDAVAQLWTMEYPSESPYGVAGRLWYVRVNLTGN
ncbi:MAG: TonB-dependent receptor plug domain-containing protein [Gemmatimonadales bacterium]|nr:TonB-dependent receptor plug domain-containing protein [Gemmatimonadales bacterium]MYG49755.1 TonB-dependent receptor plug domain-containing protein [Gemmatimonadales bacterium]MYK01549.1 TonB-dependent receptor plug domain-containing protein [Candidatus Palauibacter ramosifaciens]